MTKGRAIEGKTVDKVPYSFTTINISYEKRSWPRLGQDRLITLLDKEDRYIHDHDKIIERIEEFYSELYDSVPSTIIHVDLKGVSEITLWKVEAALRDMKSGSETNDLINIEILRAGDDTISKTFAKLYTKYVNIYYETLIKYSRKAR